MLQRLIAQNIVMTLLWQIVSFLMICFLPHHLHFPVSFHLFLHFLFKNIDIKELSFTFTFLILNMHPQLCQSLFHIQIVLIEFLSCLLDPEILAHHLTS